MVFKSGCETPAILQLWKWGSYGAQLDLSQFREAFISPTRELILLLSYNHEAVILPLAKDRAIANTDHGSEATKKLNSLSRGNSESREINSSTSGSFNGVPADDNFPEFSLLRPNSCPVISDVNSLAWGICGDSYDRHEVAVFKEILFVSGNHGVKAHAFRQPVERSEGTEPAVGTNSEDGIWVEWKSSTAFRSGISVEGDLSTSGNPNRCSRSFSTKVEMVSSNGNILTKFPEESKLPSTAMVVSFDLFGFDFPLLRFLLNGISSDSDYANCNLSISYKDCKLFANNSHDLIGFSLRLVDDMSETYLIRIVLVGRLVSGGIQWVCSVKLDETENSKGTKFEWADFKFFDKYLICLNDAGLISFYDAITGKHVARVDVLQMYGIHTQSSHQACDFANKVVFRTVLVASHTSLLAVTDNHGVVYLICASDHIKDMYNSVEKSVPQFQQLGLGTLFGWEVGGADISHRRKLSSLCPQVTLRDNCCFNTKKENKDLPDSLGIIKQKIPSESIITGFSSSSKIQGYQNFCSELRSSSLRTVFLPPDGYCEDDIICFSTVGITRIVRNQKAIDKRSFQIVHSSLHVDSVKNDTGYDTWKVLQVSCKEAVGCVFQGYCYLMSEDSVSVVIPSVSVSPNHIPVEAIGYRQMDISTGSVGQAGCVFEMEKPKQRWPPWKIEILDKVLLYEGYEEADQLCFANGWDLKVCRLRCLQLALDYLKYEEIQISLEMLADVGLAEEGVLRLLFAAVYLLFPRGGYDSDVSAASRLMAVATCFATKMIRKYGLSERKEHVSTSRGISWVKLYLPPLPDKLHSESVNSRRLHEMSLFLKIIRNLQSQFGTKVKATAEPTDDSEVSHPSSDALLPTQNQQELAATASDNTVEKLALMPTSSIEFESDNDLVKFSGASVFPAEFSLSERKFFVENPKDMIARWEMDNLDQINVVKDALLSGRLPLAVLKLHLTRLGGMIADKEPHDAFSEVRDIGRAIAYDLLLKDEIGLAVVTLQKLGENVESCLRQLVFGTLRRSLRNKIAEEMKRYGYLGPYEWKILEGISLIERVYPCSSFWSTFHCRQNEIMNNEICTRPHDEIKLHLLHALPETASIVCGEVDGAVLGSWTNVRHQSDVPIVDEDSTHSCYWAAAAVWSNAWDQRTIDRIVMGQPFLMGITVLWESQLEYHISHNDWVEVSKLLDGVQPYSLCSGSLRVSLDGLLSSAAKCSSEPCDFEKYCSIDDLDSVCMDVMNMRLLRFPASNIASTWLKALMEKQLAKKFIFLKEFWESTTELIRLLAVAGFITSLPNSSSHLDESTMSLVDPDPLNINGDTNIHAASHDLHKLVVLHCSQHNLPNLLDLYLDHHKLALDNESLSSLKDAAGDSQWAKWLLFLRVKGNEYDASFSNARSIASHNLIPGSSLGGVEIDDIIRTVDDIAEGAGEMAALATLMYSPVPIQDSLSTGSVNRNLSSSAQCTLENLRPAMQRFPTLWRTLVAACFGQDPTCNFFSPRAKVYSGSSLVDYLNWRSYIFFSAGHDTSLLQMLPGWFSKAVRRLVQLYVQGPLGWESMGGLETAEPFLLKEMGCLGNVSEQTEISTLSWEASIQKNVEEELYASSIEVENVHFRLL